MAQAAKYYKHKYFIFKAFSHVNIRPAALNHISSRRLPGGAWGAMNFAD